MPDDAAEQDRMRLRQTFDTAADRYHQARPDYPEGIFDDLTSLAALHPGDHLLEVGCGTGKATAPLARRGFRLTCLELGEQLTAVSRRSLGGFPDVTVINASFDEWQPPGAVAANTRSNAAAPGGHLAYWAATHVFPDGGDPFFREIQQVYDDIGLGGEADVTCPRPGELPDDSSDIEASGWFHDVQVRHYDWEIRYDAESYIALLDTFSGHIDLAPEDREHLYAEIRERLAGRADHVLRRHWGSVLHVATRRP